MQDSTASQWQIQDVELDLTSSLMLFCTASLIIHETCRKIGIEKQTDTCKTLIDSSM